MKIFRLRNRLVYSVALPVSELQEMIYERLEEEPKKRGIQEMEINIELAGGQVINIKGGRAMVGMGKNTTFIGEDSE